ncbi:HEAT repeat domain-containing protein [Cyclobacterium xiamenense]|uniref:HEAT repeat domain-containing protein n=1 Tax=Cyclobacterium xiamenense TaxID=1297121 RepID=UPI0035CFFD13
MDTEAEKISEWIARLLDEQEAEPLRHAARLAGIGGPQVQDELLRVLKEGSMEQAFLATKALAMMETGKEESLDALLEVIHRPANAGKNGGLVSLLEEFDLSEKFVDLFRIYLFGNFKSSALAKAHLDYEEFVISPRTLKKAEKHRQHFLNNSPKEDEGFLLKKQEAEIILKELRELLTEP